MQPGLTRFIPHMRMHPVNLLACMFHVTVICCIGDPTKMVGEQSKQ